MAQSLLVNVAIIAAILFSVICGLQASVVVEELKNDNSSSQILYKPPNVCGNKICLPGEVCFYAKIACAADLPCKLPPPQCVRIEKETGPVKPILPISPCAKVRCNKGSTCQLEKVICNKAPCLPVPKCVPVNPCAYTTCLKGYDCVPKENDPTEAECKLRDPCATVDCRTGYTCQPVIQSCPYIGPCPIPSTECVPIDPCTYTLCSDESYCVQSENDPAVAQCTEDPCSNVLCSRGEECEAIKEYCKEAPCPRPRGECVKVDKWPSCTVMLCPPGYGCRDVPVTDCEDPPCGFRGVCEPLTIVPILD